jgi:hypothetical protein
MVRRHSLFTLAVLILSTSFAVAQSPQWDAVAKELGRGGKETNGVYKVTFPRTDLKIYVGPIIVDANTALTSWAAFRMEGNEAVADGDLVVVPREMDSVMSALLNGGLEVTALHNHLINESPQVMYVHFFGRGDAAKLAAAVKDALKKTSTPGGKGRIPISPPIPEAKKIEEILGKPPSSATGTLTFSFPREHDIAMHQQKLPPAMGMATAINIQLANTGVAAAGDFVLKEDEVQPVVKAMRANGVTVTAIHNHLMDEQPRMVFVHFWMDGPAEKVATALRKALDAMNGPAAAKAP